MNKIAFDIHLPHLPTTVWQSLIDPAQLAKWLMPNNFQPRLGERFTFTDGAGKEIRCKVVDLEVGRLLAYLWDDGEAGEPSLVVWRLDPDDGGTRLRLDHAQLTTPPVTAIERHTNWQAALGRFVPVVFMSAEEDLDPSRPMIGIRNRREVPA